LIALSSISGRTRCALVAATLVVGTFVAGCASEKPPSAFEEAFNDDTKEWKELETQLPAPPGPRDLMSFPVSGATSYRFAVDAKSLSVGTDGVFRFTLVATSPSGTRNVTYEGIRCDTHEKKLYAIGRSDGTWTRARTAKWMRIEEVGNNRQHAALEKDILCPDGYNARSPEQIIARLRPPGNGESEWDRRNRGAY
jgi:CNP1-like family